jgi:hypothetical protein
MPDSDEDDGYPPVNPPPSDAYLNRWNARHGMCPEPEGLPSDLAEFLRSLN